MAITKEVKTDKLEVVGDFKTIQCREAIIIKENGEEISRSYHRHVLTPSNGVRNFDSKNVHDGTFTHTDTDISGEPQETQDVCNAVWTDDVKAAWKTFQEERLVEEGGS